MLLVDLQTWAVVIDRSDDQTIRFTITDQTGAVVDVSAGTFTFTVKQDIDDTQANAKIVKTSPSGGIDITQAASGIVDVTIASADTLSLFGTYVYDLEMVLQTKKRTLRTGRFTVRKDVTTAT